MTKISPSELLSMSTKVLYIPKNCYTSPKQISGYALVGPTLELDCFIGSDSSDGRPTDATDGRIKLRFYLNCELTISITDNYRRWRSLRHFPFCRFPLPNPNPKP